MGFGALAMTVNPPPTTDPETSAYLESKERFGTKDPRYVNAALSNTAVSKIEHRYKPKTFNEVKI